MDTSFVILFWIVVPWILLTVAYRLLIEAHIVHEYEVGLLYRNGRLVREAGPGKHRIIRVNSQMTVVDRRKTDLVIRGQELVSADGVGLKVSVAATYEVSDPVLAVHSVVDYSKALYQQIQLAMRGVVTSRTIEDLLEGRLELGEELRSLVAPAAKSMGLKLHTVAVRDVMFPGDLKNIFAEVVKARKEAQASLERARGQTAVLRNLANAARMIDDHPNLLPLRILDTVATLAHSEGNTVVLGVPAELNPTTPMPASKPARRKTAPKKQG